MSTQTKTEKVSLTGATTWTGYMEAINNNGYPITNVTIEHCCKGVNTVTCPPVNLINNQSTKSCAFSTASGETDYWFISYLDVSGNLITGSLTEDFHESSAGSTVEISLNPTSFSVTISGNKPDSSTYFQKAVAL